MNPAIPISRNPSAAFGNRIWAAILDTAFWTGVVFITTSVFGTKTTYISGHVHRTNTTLTGIPFFVLIAVGFIYNVVFDWRFGGTFGKQLIGVRVTNDVGGRITVRQALVRNLLRVIDAFPYFVPYLVGLISIAGDEHKRRIGDKVAGTQVVLTPGYPKKNSWSNLA